MISCMLRNLFLTGVVYPASSFRIPDTLSQKDQGRRVLSRSQLLHISSTTDITHQHHYTGQEESEYVYMRIKNEEQ